MQRAWVGVHLLGPAGHQVGAVARVQLGVWMEGGGGVEKREEGRNQGVTESRAEVRQKAQTGHFNVTLDCKRREKKNIFYYFMSSFHNIYTLISFQSSTDVYSQSTALNRLQLTFLNQLQLTAAKSYLHGWIYMTWIHYMIWIYCPAHLKLVSLLLVQHLPVCSAVQAAVAALHLLTTGCQCCQQTEGPAPTASGVWPVAPILPEQRHWTQSSKSLRASSRLLNRNLERKRGK